MAPSASALVSRGWFPAGSHPQSYEMGVDRGSQHSGTACGFVRARPDPEGFATLMQHVAAEAYRGQRLRMAAWVKAADVADWAGLWMRVDGPDDTVLGFDNMQHRPIRGSHDWSRFEVVLDVPAEAEAVAFGILLTGRGCVWLDDVTLDEAPSSVPTTDGLRPRRLPVRPVNLDFEE